MKPKSATFIKSATDAGGFPPPELPEIAFAGRSNVGKSSVINMLVGKTGLAKTSNTPGRTRLLNWFRIDPQKGKPLAFVDLPGYGYAKVPQAMRLSWQPMVERYLIGRDVLRVVIVLVDARRGAQQEEHELLEWLASEQIPAAVVMTKTDKLAKSKRKLAAAALERDLSLDRLPIMTSAHNREGLSELWRFILRIV